MDRGLFRKFGLFEHHKLNKDTRSHQNKASKDDHLYLHAQLLPIFGHYSDKTLLLYLEHNALVRLPQDVLRLARITLVSLALAKRMPLSLEWG